MAASVIGDRLLVDAPRPIGNAAIDVGLEEARVAGDGGVVIGDRLLEISPWRGGCCRGGCRPRSRWARGRARCRNRPMARSSRPLARNALPRFLNTAKSFGLMSIARLKSAMARSLRPLRPVGVAARPDDLEVVRIEAQRGAVVGDGAVVGALGREGVAAFVQRLEVAGLDAEDRVEIGDGAVVEPLGEVGEAAAL